MKRLSAFVVMVQFFSAAVLFIGVNSAPASLPNAEPGSMHRGVHLDGDQYLPIDNGEQALSNLQNSVNQPDITIVVLDHEDKIPAGAEAYLDVWVFNEDWSERIATVSANYQGIATLSGAGIVHGEELHFEARYNGPNPFDNGTEAEYWDHASLVYDSGAAELTVSLRRTTPYVKSVRFFRRNDGAANEDGAELLPRNYGRFDGIVQGQQVICRVTVENPFGSPLPVRVTLCLDRNQHFPWDVVREHDFGTIDANSTEFVDIAVAIDNLGAYYRAVKAESQFDGRWVKTDAWTWHHTAHFKAYTNALYIVDSEYQSLLDLYEYTGGVNWHRNAGWRDMYAPEWQHVEVNGEHVWALRLQSNNLIGTVPQSIKDLTHIRSLNLGGASIGPDFPEGIRGLRNLRDLALSTCGLEGDLPEWLVELEHLIALDLWNNQLSGSIPGFLGNMTSLVRLYLGANNFSGKIPESLYNLTNLNALGLGPNPGLTGEISRSIENLKELQQLGIGQTGISGRIPEELGSLTELRLLYMGNTLVSGEIPAALGNLLKLTSLVLSHNHLSGQIPYELGNLENLESLQLDNNQLSGAIPPSLGTAPALKRLNLWNNLLSGPVPLSIWTNTRLENLSLESNCLTGEIPRDVLGMTELKGLALAGNAFSITDPDVIEFVSQFDRWHIQTPPPANISASLSTGEAYLRWDTIPYKPGHGYYQVGLREMGTTGSFSFNLAHRTASRSDDELRVSGLDPETEYEFAVRTVTIYETGNPRVVLSDAAVCQVYLPPITVLVRNQTGNIPESVADSVFVERAMVVDYNETQWATELGETEWSVPGMNETHMFRAFHRGINAFESDENVSAELWSEESYTNRGNGAHNLVLIRNMPYVSNLQLVRASDGVAIPADATFATASVSAFEYQANIVNALNEERTVRITFKLGDSDERSAGNSIYETTTIATIPANGSVLISGNLDGSEITATGQQCPFYMAVRTETLVSGAYMKTDGWDWVEAFRVIDLDAVGGAHPINVWDMEWHLIDRNWQSGLWSGNVSVSNDDVVSLHVQPYGGIGSQIEYGEAVGYGVYKAWLKAPEYADDQRGTCSSFFVYSGVDSEEYQEIDIELVSKDFPLVHFVVHNQPGFTIHFECLLPDGAVPTDWNEYEFRWSPTEVSFFVNGQAPTVESARINGIRQENWSHGAVLKSSLPGHENKVPIPAPQTVLILNHWTGEYEWTGSVPLSKLTMMARDVSYVPFRQLYVPYYSQSDSNWCWIAAPAMAAKYYNSVDNMEIKLWEVANLRNKRKMAYGYSNDIQAVFQSLVPGREVARESVTSWGSLDKKQIRERVWERITKGHPVVFGSSDIEHAITITGINGVGDDDWIWIHDSSGAAVVGDDGKNWFQQLRWRQFFDELSRRWDLTTTANLFYVTCDEVFASETPLITLSINPWNVTFAYRKKGSYSATFLDWNGKEYPGTYFVSDPECPLNRENSAWGDVAYIQDLLRVSPTVLNMGIADDEVVLTYDIYYGVNKVHTFSAIHESIARENNFLDWGSALSAGVHEFHVDYHQDMVIYTLEVSASSTAGELLDAAQVHFVVKNNAVTAVIGRGASATLAPPKHLSPNVFTLTEASLPTSLPSGYTAIAAVSIGPSGTEFDPAAILRIDRGTSSAFQTVTGEGVIFHHSDGEWVALNTLYHDNGVPNDLTDDFWTAQVNGLSLFAFGVPSDYVVAQPQFDPDDGTHPGSSVEVTVTCATDGATIRYTVGEGTTPGADPTESSATVPANGVVNVPVPGWLKARAWKDEMAASEVRTAVYNVVMHSVSFDPGLYGTRTGGGELEQTVAHGGSATAPTVGADEGWRFIGWDVPFDDVTGPLTVTAQYERKTYTLTYTAGANGNIDGESEVVQTVLHGDDGEAVTAIPDEGYRFVQWNDDVTTATRTDTNIMANRTVTAEFEPKWVPAITWPAPEPIVYGTTLGDAQLDAEADTPGAFVYDPPAGTVLAAGTHTLTAAFTPDDDVNWAGAEATVELTVTKAPLTVTADDKARPYGQANPPLTWTATGFVAGDDASVVEGAPELACGAVPDSPVADGPYPITIAAGTLAAANYAFAFVDGTLTVTRAEQAIDFAAPPARTYGDAPFALEVTASSGLPVELNSSEPAVAALSEDDGAWTVTIHSAGETILTASQPGDANWNPAEPVAHLLQILPHDTVVYHTVTFQPGNHGRLPGVNSGINYEVLVEHGNPVPEAPEVFAHTGWTHTGWDWQPAIRGDAPATITQNWTVTALYAETPGSWRLDMVLTGAAPGTLTMGMHPDGTDGFDPGLDQDYPLPVAGHACLASDDLFLSYSTDYRGISSRADFLLIASASDEADVTVTWPDPQLPPGQYLTAYEVVIESVVPGRGAVPMALVGGTAVNMAGGGTLEIPAGETRAYVIRYADHTVFDLALAAGWSMISLPLTPDDARANSVLWGDDEGRFVDGSALRDGVRGTLESHAAWQWVGQRYETVTEFQACVGYWVHMPEAAIRQIEGQPANRTALELRRGWNLVGVERTSALPDDPRIIGAVWGWDAPTRQYERTDALLPGLAYWINASSAGSIPLAALSSPPGESLRSPQVRSMTPDAPAEDVQELVAGNTRFALDLYAAACGAPGNLFMSPYSISVAMAMTYAGARGQTELQMADTLHFGLSQDRLHPAFNELDLLLAGRGKGAAGADGEPFRLNIVNQLWGQTGYAFLAEFLDTLAINYDAGLRLLNFAAAPEPARVGINNWVSDHTAQRIRDLIPQGGIDTLTRLVLVNAIYFNAAWHTPFPRDETADGTFTQHDGTAATVPMMFQEATYPLHQGAHVTAIELPYDGQELSMVLLVPDAGRFEQFEAALDADTLEGILGALTATNVRLTMPKFAITGELSLAAVLAGMGMPAAFTAQTADFSGMDGSTELYLKNIFHKAFVAVDEAGTEAAAATAVVVGITSLPEDPVEVVVDRPFIFLIRDIPTGTILFIGRTASVR